MWMFGNNPELVAEEDALHGGKHPVQENPRPHAGGVTPNPTYREVCTGRTNHVEVVRVVYDPSRVSLEDLVRVGLEAHDPTQGYRQGNDVGTQYRSAFYTEGPNAAEEKQRIDKLVDADGEKLQAKG